VEIRKETVLDDKIISKIIPDEISFDKPIAWEFPSITSKRDTENISPDVEQLTRNEYDTMRADFIRTIITPNVEVFEKNYRLYIIVDAFPELYRGNKDSQGNDIVTQDKDGKYEFTSPQYQGEVIVVENPDGTRPTIADFFGEKYPSIVHLPVVLSFDKGRQGGMWFGNKELLAMRAAIKSSKEGTSPADAIKAYEREDEITRKGREHVKKNPEDKIEINIAYSTDGINPKTKNSPVIKRFGDFTFEVAKPLNIGGTETQLAPSGRRYPKGVVYAKIGKSDFPVTTESISKYGDLYNKVVDTLDYKFEDSKLAETVRNQFLSILVYTNENQFFTIDKEGDHFKINFRRAREADVKAEMTEGQIRKNAIISDVSKAQLNVSIQGMNEGYSDFDPATGTLTYYNAEDYTAMIKPKLVTNLKKILDQDGNLYFDPVNPYFSFVVTDSKIPDTGVKTKEEIQEEYYNRLKARIESLKKGSSFNPQQVRVALQTEFNKGNINQAHYNALFKMTETGNKVEEAIRVTEELLEAKTEEEIRETRKEASSVLDKYKIKPKEDIGKVISEPDQAKEYKVSVRGQQYLYNAANNKIYLMAQDKPEEASTSASLYGQVLEQFAQIYPYVEAEGGNSGFNKLEIESEEGAYKIFAPPTTQTNSEIIVSPRGMQFKDGLEGLKKILSPEGKSKLEEFLNRYCR
jgi:hypothetical protein